MAVTTDAYTNADAVAFIGEVWTPIVNEAFFDATVFANFVTDLSAYAQEGGDIFNLATA